VALFVSSQVGLAFWSVMIVAAYKIASLLVGLGFGYMGYRLFLAGIGSPAAELEASAGERKLRLSQAAPGIFFALFGAAVVAATIHKGLDIELPGAVNDALWRLPADPPPLENDDASG
jgi:hypothetical protein